MQIIDEKLDKLTSHKQYGSLGLTIFKDREVLDTISQEQTKIMIDNWKSSLATFEDSHNVFRNAFKDLDFFFNCPKNYHPSMLGPFSTISKHEVGDIIVSSMDNKQGTPNLQISLISNTFLNDIIIKNQDLVVLHLKQNESKTKVISFIPGTWLESVMPYLETTLHQHVTDILETHTSSEKTIELQEYHQWQQRYGNYSSDYMDTAEKLLEISTDFSLNTQYQLLTHLKSNWKDEYKKFFSEHIFNKSFLLSLAQNMNKATVSKLPINNFQSLTIEPPTKLEKTTVIVNDNTESSLSLKYHYSLHQDKNTFDKYDQDICVYDGDVMVLELNLKDAELEITHILPGPWVDSFVNLFNVDLLKYHMDLNKNVTNEVNYSAFVAASFD